MSIRFIPLGLIPPLLFSVSMDALAQAFDKNKLGDSEPKCQALSDEVKETDALAVIS